MWFWCDTIIATVMIIFSFCKIFMFVPLISYGFALDRNTYINIIGGTIGANIFLVIHIIAIIQRGSIKCVTLFSLTTCLIVSGSIILIVFSIIVWKHNYNIGASLIPCDNLLTIIICIFIYLLFLRSYKQNKSNNTKKLDNKIQTQLTKETIELINDKDKCNVEIDEIDL